MRIDGIVILYNPDETVVKNITSYVNCIDKLYIVDNSEKKNIDLISRIMDISKKVEYIDNGGNQGIAKALNMGAKLAIKNGANWLLAMDQDSYFEKNEISIYIQNIVEFKDKDNVAIFAPNTSTPTYSIYSKRDTNSFVDSTVIITSGSVINLDLFSKIGEFDENLFIDEVDHDYCLRAVANNYRVIMFNNIFLNHQIGIVKKIKLLNKEKSITIHSPVRNYYAMRNVLYMRKKHKNNFGSWTKKRVSYVIKDNLRNLIFGEYKLRRIFFILKGIIDFHLNNMGKIKIPFSK